jgi:cob(I)alamin adenosyltransferase
MIVVLKQPRSGRNKNLKIYTKTGDSGQTGLLGGKRVSKSHLAVGVCGGLDETNSLLGLALSHSLPSELAERLTQIQNDLFDLGSRIAACLSETAGAAEFPFNRIDRIENWIDRYQADLPELTQFILPGGSLGGATLHLCRTVCRRAERDLVTLIDALKVSAPENFPPNQLATELIYLNRLSDFLFVVARYVNQIAGVPETNWRVSKLS